MRERLILLGHYPSEPLTRAQYLTDVGIAAHRADMYSRAERALVIRKKPLGPEHPNDAIQMDRAASGGNRSSLLVMIALGFGGMLTIAWTSVLIWTAGYVVGVW